MIKYSQTPIEDSYKPIVCHGEFGIPKQAEECRLPSIAILLCRQPTTIISAFIHPIPGCIASIP